MAGFQFTPTSFNGTLIVSGGSIANAYFLVPNSPGSTQAMGVVAATIPGTGEQDVRGQPQSAIWRLRVQLSSVNETDLQALRALFNEQMGLVYLRVTDGASAIWRCAVRVTGIDMITAGLYDIVLYAPNPTWEEDAGTTNSQLNQQTSPVTATITNNGNRDMRPAFTLTADAAKTNTLNDYAFSFQGFIVNRSPLEIVNMPVWLTAVGGVSSRFATDSSASGATVKQTTGLTTIAANIAALATTITLTSAASWPASGMGYITDTRGVGFDDQFAYTSISGNILQGVTWMAASAIGGTSNPTGTAQTAGGTAHTTAQVSAIQPSGALLSGDDCRVWLDDVPDQSRWLVGWDTSATDVVINVSLPGAPRIIVDTATAMTASSPGNGGAITLGGDLSAFPASGFVMVGSGPTEIIHYTSRAGRTLLGLQRGCWGTTPATQFAHANVFPNARRYIVSCGNAAATPPPCPSDQRPACQLPASTNTQLHYGDEVDDPETIFYDRNNPDRTAQFVPGFDADGNSVSPILSVSQSNTILTFKDDVPGDGSPPYNFLELTIPQGIQAGPTTAITHDWTPAAEVLNLELWGRDSNGTLKLLDQLQQAAAATGRQLPAGLSSTAYGVKLKGRYNVVTGFRGSDSSTITTTTNTTQPNLFPPPAGIIGISFTIAQTTFVSALAFRAKIASGSATFSGQVVPDNSGIPDLTATHRICGINLLPVSTSPGFVTLALTRGQLFKPGTYWIIGGKDTGGTDIAILGSALVSQDSQQLDWNGSVWSGGGGTAWVYAISSYDQSFNAPVQADQPVLTSTGARTGTTASFDNAIYVIQVGQSIFVNRASAFTQTLVHMAGVLANTTTGDSIAIDKWMKPTSTLAIDCNARTVIYTEDTVDYPVTKAITPSNTADWMACPAGSNAITYTDAALIAPGQIDVVTTFRGVKA